MYKHETEKAANFYNLTKNNITVINRQLSIANGSRNRNRPQRQVVAEMNGALRDARIVDVHFKESIDGIPGVRLVGGPAPVDGFQVTSN